MSASATSAFTSSGVGGFLAAREVAGLGQRGHESIGRLGGGAHGLQAELGDIGVELLAGERLGQRRHAGLAVEERGVEVD